MATRFEAVVAGEDSARCRAAGEEALEEVEGLEALLTAFRPTSDIGRINASAGRDWVCLDPRVYTLLRRCRELSVQTEGAFDITVGPLLRAWGFHGSSGRWPEEADIRSALALCGADQLQLDEDGYRARLDSAGASLDLGAVGKGYAVDAAVDLLRESGVPSALLHGGTSTVKAMGEAYPIEIAYPGDQTILATVTLEDGLALSVSAGHGKSFTGPDGQQFGHVLDPRTGRPVAGAVLAAVCAPSAMLTDAISTALLVLGPAGLEIMHTNWPDASALVLPADGRPQTLGAAFTAGLGSGAY